MNQTFMKTKPILPLVLSMSLPMVLSMTVNSLYNIVDSFFVAKISEDAMTALSLVFPVQNFINSVAVGFSIGINAVISYYLGAQKNDKACTAATLGLLLNALHGILLAFISIAIMPAFLGMFTDSPQVIDLGLRYARIAFSFSVIITMGLSFEKMFQAAGKMTITMGSMMLGCISNIIFDPILIFGLAPFPQMGMAGAALATGIGQTVSLLYYLAIYIARPDHLRLGFKYITLQKEIILPLYTIGIPATLNMALPSLLISALNAILSTYAQTYVVVLGVYYKLQTFLYLPANGIIQGIRPLVGYNYGAGEHQRVRKIYTTTLSLTAVIMLIGTILCWSIPAPLIGLFTENSETITIGADALRIISIGFIFSTFSVAACGALEGLGKGGPSLVISLLRYTVVIIPAAFILSKIFGAAGVWHAFWLAELISGTIACFIYKKATLIR